MVPPIPKRGRSNNNEDMISELSDCIIIHILSYLDAKIAVQTCLLSKRWENLWKKIPSLTLDSTQFSTSYKLSTFLSRFSDLRDDSIALRTLDFKLVTRSNEDCQSILSSMPSFQTLTSLKLAVNIRPWDSLKAFFPDYLKFPSLVNLELTNLMFRDRENVGYVEPFSVFKKLNSLILRGCATKNNAKILISSLTLINLTIDNNLPGFSYIELSAPRLSSITLTGTPVAILCERSLAFVKELNFDTNTSPVRRTLLNLLQQFPNIESLTVSACALKVVSLNPDWWKHKLLSMHHLKKLKVKIEPSISFPNGIVDILL
ncbi:F-box/RNI/FBD-like domain protein [Medicago truncatula]|uniref:F-box/RNI/FBD-like domain protein n=2 Tax=Medicago truncatula TaxID=3880 RepID=A0A072VHM9_MEDTR|nr:F-box/RNI/FBD-like domain protein [Medicago truncatula]